MKAKTVTKWNDIDMAELELSKLIEHFAYTKKAEGKSAITVAWYQEQLRHFMGYLTSTGRQAVLGEFGVEVVREYIVQQQDRGLSTYTVIARIRALKAFSTWLHEENYGQRGCRYVRSPRMPLSATVQCPTSSTVKVPMQGNTTRSISLNKPPLDRQRLCPTQTP